MRFHGFVRRSAVNVALLTAGIGQPMLQMYGDNLAVFTSARMSGGNVVSFAALVVIAPVLAVLVLDAVASVLPGRAARAAHVAVTSVATLPLALVVLRNTPGPWQAVVPGAAVISVALATATARVRGLRTWASWMSPLAPAVFGMFLFSAQSVVWEAKASVVSVASSTTSVVPVPDGQAGPVIDPADVSVLWLQLDEAPLWPLLGPDGNINKLRFPGFAALADNSTWFRNALGLSQTTVDAVPATLAGRIPVTGKAPTYSNYRKNLFSLAYGHRAMDVHEIATALCPKEACATVSVSGSDEIADGNAQVQVEATTTTVAAAGPQSESLLSAAPPDWPQFLRDASVVLGHKLLPRGLRDRLPRIDEGWGGFGEDTVSRAPATTTTSVSVTTTTVGEPTGGQAAATTTTAVESIEKNTVRGWERDGARSQVPVVRDMVRRAARSSLATVHFAHVLLPHRPWQLTPDMRTTRFVATDPRESTVEDRVRDEYQAFLAQYVATDSLVLQLVNDMKRSSNWDRTMIVVTADHGLAFEPGESKRKDINTDRPDTLQEIYRVPMFVKWPGQQAPAVSDCAAQGFDLLPSVVAATGLDAGWKFDGVDMKKVCPQRATRKVWWNKGSTTLSGDFGAARTTAARFDAWVDDGSGTDGIAMVAGTEGWFGVSVPESLPQDPSVRGWTLRDAPLFRGMTDAEFAKVPLQIDGSVRVTGTVPKGSVGLIVMDGRVAAVIPELSGMAAGTRPWRSMVLPSALTAGNHSPVLLVAAGTPQDPALTRVGTAG